MLEITNFSIYIGWGSSTDLGVHGRKKSDALISHGEASASIDVLPIDIYIYIYGHPPFFLCVSVLPSV